MRGRLMMVENEKEEDMEHWYCDLKIIHTQPLTVFASPQRDQSVLRNTGRGGQFLHAHVIIWNAMKTAA